MSGYRLKKTSSGSLMRQDLSAFTVREEDDGFSRQLLHDSAMGDEASTARLLVPTEMLLVETVDDDDDLRLLAKEQEIRSGVPGGCDVIT